jgi:ParB family chromosome partitioning protein
MLRIASTVPRATLLAIGPAPEIGRRRWIDFVEVFEARADGADCIQHALETVPPAVGTDRFAIALAALKTEVPQAPIAAAQTSEIRANGFLLATVSYPKSGPRINFTKSVPTSFVEFLNDRMETLHGEFLQSVDHKRKG